MPGKGSTIYFTARGVAYHRYSKCHRLARAKKVLREKASPEVGDAVTIGGRVLRSCDDCGQ